MTKKEFQEYCRKELAKITSKPVNPEIKQIIKNGFERKYGMDRRINK